MIFNRKTKKKNKVNNDEYFKESIEQAVETQSVQKKGKQVEESIYKAVREFEEDIINSKDKRITQQNRIIIGCIFILVLMGVALASLAPLKTAVPYLLRVDSTTGYVDKVEPYSNSGETVDESVIRYFIARFIENREGYEWYTVQEMYDFVELSSNKSVFDDYSGYMLSDYSPVKKLSDKHKMQVKVNGITFLGDAMGTAQVRFTKLISNNDGSMATGYVPTSWIATIKFDFGNPPKKEAQRLVNPMGLRVYSYRVDSEVIK